MHGPVCPGRPQVVSSLVLPCLIVVEVHIDTCLVAPGTFIDISSRLHDSSWAVLGPWFVYLKGHSTQKKTIMLRYKLSSEPLTTGWSNRGLVSIRAIDNRMEQPWKVHGNTSCVSPALGDLTCVGPERLEARTSHAHRPQAHQLHHDVFFYIVEAAGLPRVLAASGRPS